MAQDLKEKLGQKAGAITELKKPLTIMEEINALAPQLNRAMPGFLRKFGADKLARLAQTEFRRSRELAMCSRDSFYATVMDIAQLGLEPGRLGHCYFVPYKGVCTLIIGYRGILELVERSGRVDTIYAYPVFIDDEFDFCLGDKPMLKHTPNFDSELNDERIRGFYAIAHIKGSNIPRIEFMTKKQVDAIRNRSGAKTSGPWATDYAEMGRKTVLKRLCKTLPLSTEVQNALAMDETARPNLDSDLGPVSVYDLVEPIVVEPVQPASE